MSFLFEHKLFQAKRISFFSLQGQSINTMTNKDKWEMLTGKISIHKSGKYIQDIF